MDTLRLFVLILSALGCAKGSGLEVLFQWKYLEWAWPSVQLAGKNYTLGNSFTQDVDVDRKGRIFVTSPQWLDGVPITLSLISDRNGKGGPLLIPYPDASWHRPFDCNSMISVYRIAIDECNRLWVVDAARIERKAVCPPKILIFDLRTDRLIHKYVVPYDQALFGSASFVTPIVDVGKMCLDTYLYVADVDQNGLLIYDLFRDYSWRLNNTRGNAFGPDSDPDSMSITIVGETFNLTDGTLGMSLSPKGYYNQRYLYFNSLASYFEKFTDTLSLKESEYREPVIFQSNYRRASQAGVQATSKRGVIFFQLVQLTAIACWNIDRPFTPENVVVISQDEETLQYVSGIKVITNHYGEEELWFVTNRLQKTINNTRKQTELNMRIIGGKVDDLIRGTNCEPSHFKNPVPDTTYWHQI